MRRAFAVALVACCAPLALAQTPPAQAPEAQGDGRFVFHEVEEGILRLDTRLGEMSLCSRQSAGWTCRIIPDERSALDAELSRLQQENAELRTALVGREPKAGTPSAAPPETPRSAPSPDGKTADPMLKVPTAEDIERARTVVVTIWRRLVEMMAHLRQDLREKG